MGKCCRQYLTHYNPGSQCVPSWIAVTGPVASHPDRLPCRSPLDGGGALGRRPRSGTCSSWAFFASTGALRRSAKLVFLDLFISILYAQGKRLLAQAVDGFRSALATPYSRAWTRPRLKSSRACRDGSLRSSSVRLSDGVMTSVERCRLRYRAEFPVALLQSQNRTTERRLSRANYVAGCVSKI